MTNAQSTLQSGPKFVGPTIKGIFVNSHVDAVRRAKGDAGVRDLERRFGRSVDFKATSDVPIRDEVRLIELALDQLYPGQFEADQRPFEAGRLHFRNFTTTPWAKVLFTIFPQNFKFMMLHCSTIAERVFRGVTLAAYEEGPNAVRVVMGNNDYPMEHFRGLFQEWMDHFGYAGSVIGEELDNGVYQYYMTWSPK